MERYLLFAKSTDRVPVAALPEGMRARFIPWYGTFSRGLPVELRRSIFRWRLLCAAFGRPLMPRVYVVQEGSTLVHHAFILPPLNRIPGMRSHDIEIGPCWTHPRYRRRGLFRHSLSAIYLRYNHPARVFWMLVREENVGSVSGIAGAGFIRAAECAREARRILPAHIYVAVSSSVTEVNDMDCVRDLIVEQARYNRRASEGVAPDLRHGAAAVPEELRQPYIHYHQSIAAVVRPDAVVVDLCSGDGLHTMTAAIGGGRVYAVDVAEESLKLARQRSAAFGYTIETIVANAEKLPLPDHSVDLVTCAGGLSYMDRTAVIGEVRRLLKPVGRWIIVDSFNHNWIYRLNRWVHYRRGRRTLSTLQRMPDRSFVSELEKHFRVEVSYYGILSFTLPLLVRLVGAKRAAEFLTWSDGVAFPLREWCFRVVIVATMRPSDVKGLDRRSLRAI